MKIVGIGAGNVAWHLLNRFADAGHTIVQVYSRTEHNAASLAQQVGATGINNLNHLYTHADLYIISLSDDVTERIANSLPFSLNKNQVICHTSGVLSSNILKDISKNYGCFYPFQTLTKGHFLDFDLLPICISASNEKTNHLLQKLASKISTQLHVIDDHQKKYLHLTGVLVNNFSNHLIHHAHTILEQREIDTSMIHPLLQNTLDKIKNIKPLDAQTGPARRGDHNTIERHQKLIEEPTLKEIYTSITHSILKTYHENC